MNTHTVAPAPPASRVALIGGLSMAAAMGIGRFAFTPLLPLMQAAQHLAIADGTWLALANYLGYLLGAVAGFVRPPRPGAAVRWGVASVAVSTAAMAFASAMGPWLVLRFVAGVGSAFVMLGVAGWALTQLASAGRGALAGWVFGSVGLGIAGAGAVAFAAAASHGDARPAWAVLGVAAACIAAAGWRSLSREPDGHRSTLARTPPLDRETWVLVVCYGVAGFGYIVPATFLPAAARALVDDPAVFGWIWPTFGIAATIGTVGVSTFGANLRPRSVCAVGMLVMAVGTAAPVVHTSIATLIVSAVCVGGTFILVTLAGLQEARRIAAASAAKAVAAMTASFALGQLAGPVLAHAGASALTAMQVPCIAATIGLVGSATMLLVRRAR